MPRKAGGGFEPIVGYTDPSPIASGGTRADPTLVTDGIDVQGATGVRVIISADSGATLSGTGSVRMWGWSVFLARWYRVPSLDFDMDANVAGKRDSAVDMPLVLGWGRVFPQPVAVASSAGNITPSCEAGVLP